MGNRNTLLLRGVDDYLMITTDPVIAKEFAVAIHSNTGEIKGFDVNIKKSLANFEVEINGQRIPLLSDSRDECRDLQNSPFPWFGLLIDTQHLNIFCDNGRFKETGKYSLGYSKYLQRSKTRLQ